jgi:hypothetical protein
VRYHHKFGQTWSAKYGMIRSFEVSYDEIDVVDAEVVSGAKLYCQYDLSQGLRGLPYEHSPKRCIVRLEIFWLNV